MRARARPVLVDVREPWEHAICGLPGALQLPMNAVPARADELDPAADTVVICHHGARSFQVGMFLERRGFARVYNSSAASTPGRARSIRRWRSMN